MKTLTHNEWQAIIKKEEDLLNEYLNGETSNSQKYLDSVEELAKIKTGGTSCLGCTLGKSLPH